MENLSQLMQYSIIDLLAIIYLCLLIVSIDGFEIEFFSFLTAELRGTIQWT